MSWLAALGQCASPKSKVKERKPDGSHGRPHNLASLKRRGSLTDVRPSRKVQGSRSFREKIQDTFEGSLRKGKKAGSLEAVGSRSETFGNPDTNMNVSTSLRPRVYKGSASGTLPTGTTEQELAMSKDKFWTNFYNTLPRNRHKDRPKDLSLQDLPTTEGESEIDLTSEKDKDVKTAQKDIQWQGYATSPRTKRKNKTLERMNSAPNTRRSPQKNLTDGENRPGSDGKVSPQVIEVFQEGFDGSPGSEIIIMPRSVSLQEEYWVPATKGGSRVELRKVSQSPDRLGVRRSPVGSPVNLQGHVWVRTKDGAHVELRAIERHNRDIPSPSDSQKTDSSTATYNMTASTLTNMTMVPKFPVEDMLPAGYASSTTQTSNHSLTGSYVSPEEYQANIFDLIQSLNQSPPNPASPEVKRSRQGKHSRSQQEVKQGHRTSPEDSSRFHSEKFIVLGNSSPDGGEYENREQPIFSVRCHVFQIDPETKKNWLPASKTSVAVSYYYDSARNTYRIISVEGSKAIINSTITPNMAFTKTSQKFGQWSDPRANTVYGLGFSTEADLAKFIEKFKEVKEMTRQQLVQSQSPTTVNGTGDDSQSSSSTTTPRETPPNRGFFHTRSSSLTSMREPQQQTEQKENINLKERRNSFNNPGSNGSSSPESQLKYENDRLKLALAQSSANAKKWEIELQTLKNNNARLTAALQESTANVEEWKKQLGGYKDETSRMKKKISELEKSQSSPDQVSSLQTEVTELRDNVDTLQRENQYKDQEVDRLQQRLAEMTTRETANGNLQNKIKVDDVKAMEEENRSLHQKVHDLQQLLQDYRTSQENEKDEVIQLQDHLGSKITELYEFHEQILATLKKESNS
ncbi:uncharacterized protein LOC132756393 isoform X3 [Ruditapes philippinarum]|uniref:uncharacterized protein LOC132756393 isoform X3 n=1 Tax=Ruditapes philippinarum TaxID=129788 RepID=UPI00295C2F25|nr:uncharacterized protein LOC132756393 isoform X3 [Ruditapes philippinarum]